MSMPGNDQRNAITMALMGIANPPGKKQLPQPGMPPQMPQNIGQGMSAIGGALGQPAPQQPGRRCRPPRRRQRRCRQWAAGRRTAADAAATEAWRV